MTACARGAGSFKNHTGVAAVAADILMSAVEVEAGTKMVEWLLCTRRGGNQQDTKNHRD
jgi:hypothetical protein